MSTNTESFDSILRTGMLNFSFLHVDIVIIKLIGNIMS